MVHDHPSAGESLLFNGRTRALIKIDPVTRAGLETLRDTGKVAPELEQYLDALIESGVLTTSREQEDALTRDCFDQISGGSGLTFEATVLTTYACNFGCVYCFEQGVREPVYMDRDTAERTAAWLCDRCDEAGSPGIHLVYYGGEPLLHTAPVYTISPRVRRWAERNKRSFGFSIITNGSLLSRNLVDELRPLGLSSVRVTVDGERDTHNAHRPFADGSPSFDRIMDNIRSVIDAVPLGITGVYEPDSIGAVYRFLDYLEAEGLLEKLNGLGFAPMVPRLGPRDNPGKIELAECLAFYDQEGFMEQSLALTREIKRRGVPVKTGLGVNACPLIMKGGGVIVDPLGRVYKCSSLLGYEEFSIGTVNDAGYNERFDMFHNARAWERCPQDCPHLIMCQGGCRFFSYMENGNFTDVCCKRAFYDKMVPELIKLEYERLCAQ